MATAGWQDYESGPAKRKNPMVMVGEFYALGGVSRFQCSDVEAEPLRERLGALSPSWCWVPGTTPSPFPSHARVPRDCGRSFRRPDCVQERPPGFVSEDDARARDCTGSHRRPHAGLHRWGGCWKVLQAWCAWLRGWVAGAATEGAAHSFTGAEPPCTPQDTTRCKLLRRPARRLPPRPSPPFD